MRCCIETIRAYNGTQREGTIVPCNYCSSSIRSRDGAWEWNHD